MVGPDGGNLGPLGPLDKRLAGAESCGFSFSPQETGFWFIFHHVPTGPSVGMYSPGYSEHIPLGKFLNNRAHSNYRVSVSGSPIWAAPRPEPWVRHETRTVVS